MRTFEVRIEGDDGQPHATRVTTDLDTPTAEQMTAAVAEIRSQAPVSGALKLREITSSS